MMIHPMSPNYDVIIRGREVVFGSGESNSAGAPRSNDANNPHSPSWHRSDDMFRKPGLYVNGSGHGYGWGMPC